MYVRIDEKVILNRTSCDEKDLVEIKISDSQPLLSVVMDVTKCSLHLNSCWKGILCCYHRCIVNFTNFTNYT